MRLQKTRVTLSFRRQTLPIWLICIPFDLTPNTLRGSFEQIFDYFLVNLTGDIQTQSHLRQMAEKLPDTGGRTKNIQDSGAGKLNRAVSNFRMEEDVLNEGQIKVGTDNR
jgi:hypothetical protein